MGARVQNRIKTEIECLRSEYTHQGDPGKSAQLYAAMQALEWSNDPNNAAAPTWVILAGKALPLKLGTLEG